MSIIVLPLTKCQIGIGSKQHGANGESCSCGKFYFLTLVSYIWHFLSSYLLTKEGSNFLGIPYREKKNDYFSHFFWDSANFWYPCNIDGDKVAIMAGRYLAITSLSVLCCSLSFAFCVGFMDFWNHCKLWIYIGQCQKAC